MLDMEQLETICEEIERLENSEMSWANIEKLSALYNVEHHTRKKMQMSGENSESSTIGFQGNGQHRQLREMANNMSKQQLANIITSYARELNENGNNQAYNQLYNRVRRGNNGNQNT